MARDVEATLEDLEWMDESRVGATDAAERAKFPSAVALEKWLERHDRYDLWLRLKQRDPDGMHWTGARRMEPATTIDSSAKLLADASRSGKARIRNKGRRVASLLDELRAEVDAEITESREKEKIRAEVERLERQLSDARARLRGQSYTASQVTTSAREIREWAAANGVPCNTQGKIPSTVRKAFEAAHSSERAS